MPRETDFEVKGRILELYQLLKSSRKVEKNLEQKGIIVSYRTVQRIVKKEFGVEKTKQGKAKKRKNPGSPLVRTPALIKNIARAVNTPNPPSQNELSRKYGVSKGTIGRILKKDLGLNFKKKVRTHVLTPKMADQRLERGPRFRKWLSRRKLPYIITIDETYISMNDVSGQREGYYESAENPVPSSWKKNSRSGWPGKVMVTMGICMRGKTSLYMVPSKVKMNHELFINDVLEPLFKNDVPRLYPGEEHKVILHMDSASSHTDWHVVEWLKNRKINFIPKEDWMSNSPDLSPMDYAINGIFKKKCNKHHGKSMAQLVSIAKRVWKDFDLGMIINTLKAWPGRVDRMLEESGYQIENTF